jgi:DNA-binding transcriptional regulator GbsR (MarR family)
MNVMFDTLQMVQRFEIKGFSRQQAEELVGVVTEVQHELATKKDIEDLIQNTKKDINDLRKDVKKDMDDLRKDVKNEFDGVRKEFENAFKYFKLQMFTAMIVMTVVIKPEIITNIFG